MLVFDGTYRLQPGANQGLNPGNNLVCAWRVRIINLTVGQPAIQQLRPTIVLVNQTGLATSLTSCAEKEEKKISLDLKLDIKKVLWIEHLPTKPGLWYAAVFTPTTGFGSDINYNIQWRPARPNEIGLLKPFIPDIDDI